MAITARLRVVAAAEQRSRRHGAERRARRTIAGEAVLAPNVLQVVSLAFAARILDRRSDKELLHVKQARKHFRRNAVAARALDTVDDQRMVSQHVAGSRVADEQVRP